ncbi:MAG: M14 family metallopeptidase [Armatimonadetes bacterium]|nr:M14 family metallopeptidase [Armatimonadota bacterium]
MLAAVLTIAAAKQDPWPVTHAEATNFEETSHYEHVVEFLDALAKVTTAQVSYVGSTEGGRKIPLVIAAKPPVSTPLEAKQSGKPVVYIQANIHGGEVEGKEAAQMILRDLYRTDSPLLEQLIFVVVPIYNIDGNEKWGDGKVKRRSQTGPDVVGDRTNDAGLDLNRDCMKAESPEMQTVLKYVYNAWDPDVVFDLHTTNGTRHGYDLTFSPPLHPNTHPLVRGYTQDELMPRVRARLGDDVKIFPYGNTGPRDGVTAWSTFSHEGRYVTNYGGLRNRIAILSEAMSYAPFEERVESTYKFVMACLEEIAADADRVVAQSRQADADMATWSKQNRSFGVRFEFASRGEEDVLLEKAPTEGEDRRTGKITETETAKMQIFDRFKATRTAPMPAAYIIPPSEKAVLELLLLQGAVVERLSEDWTGDAAGFIITEVDQAERAFQGHRMIRLEGEFQIAEFEFPSGHYMVRTGQPLGMLIFYLLEPESLDGVVAWEVLSQKPLVNSVFPIFKVRDISGVVSEVVTEIGATVPSPLGFAGSTIPEESSTRAKARERGLIERRDSPRILLLARLARTLALPERGLSVRIQARGLLVHGRKSCQQGLPFGTDRGTRS